MNGTSRQTLRERWTTGPAAELRLEIIEALGKVDFDQIVSRLPLANEVPDGFDLRGIDLSGKVMLRAWFPYASLDYAIFDGAQLDGSLFDFCSLKGASFKGASLCECQFTCAKAAYADFCEAQMQYSHLDHANFTNAIFDRADVRHAFGTDTAIFAGASSVDLLGEW